MKLIIKLLTLMTITFHVHGTDLEKHLPFPLEKSYQKLIMTRVAEKLPCLVTFPFLTYPNQGFEILPQQFSSGKVRVFGYGSLMNKLSASRSVGEEALETMEPAIAFGVKRIFNYKANKTSHWGEDQNPKEKAMLNMVQTMNIASVANGVTIEVNIEDLKSLVQRETGYDLVPILVGSWDEIKNQEVGLKIQLAYTFVANHELREHIDYTSTEFYPVRGYMHAVQQASLAYGEDFAEMWNQTTYLADGTTAVADWDEVTFKGILCTFKP